MNKKKKIKLIASTSLALATTLTLVSCGSKTTSYTVEFNVNDPDTSDSIKLDTIETVKVKKGDKVSSKTLTYEGYTFDGWYLSDGTKYDFSKEVTSNLTLIAKWTKNTTPTTPTTEKVTITFNTNGGSSVASQEIDKGTKATMPTAPTKAETDSVTYTFEGWYTDEALTAAFSFDTAVSANITLYAKWSETPKEVKPQDTTQTVIKEITWNDRTYDNTTTNTYDNVVVYAGGELDKSSTKKITKYDETTVVAPRLKLKGVSEYDGGKTDSATGYEVGTTVISDVSKIKSKAIKVTLQGKGQLDIAVAPAGTGERSITILDSNGKSIYTKSTTTSDVFNINLTGLEKGDYYIVESNGYNFYYIGTKVEAEKSEATGIEISTKGKTSYFAGQTLDTSSIKVNLKYKNGATDELSSNDYEVTSTFDKTKAGTYSVTVKYKENTNFTASYDVNVYDLANIELGFNAIEKSSSNTKAGNGQYINKTVQQVYKLNDTLDKDALTITALSENNSYEELLDTAASYVTISGFDSTTSGEKTVTVKVTLNGVEKTQTFKVYVVDTAVCKATVNSATICNVYVDKNYTGTIGAKTTLSQYTDDSNAAIEANTFTTIQQALDFLGLQDGISEYRKNVYIAEGTYNEKLELTLPYTSLIATSANAENTIIEWDSVYGKEDESGFSHVTDSTQTVAVRESAKCCELIGITISNYYNSISAYNGTSYEGSGERALALLVQGDKLLIQNSRLLGWQDTIELFTGRAYIKDSFICGTVDYIFGTNGTAYFDGCTIETRKGKASGTDDKVNAYITAFKGQNKSSSDAPKYGAIFNNCNFTTSSDFVGTYAIARPWASTSNVVYLNSKFDSKLATDENKTISTGLLSDVNIATLNIKFYNNKYADGTAITLTDNLSNVNTILTAEEAAKYTEFATIFGKTNGGVTYDDVWDPESKSIDVDDKTYYYFNGLSSSTGTSYTYTEKASGKTTTLGGLTIDATSGKLEARTDGDSQWNAGTTISLDVEANTSITVNTYSTTYGYKVAGSVDTTVKYANSDTVTYFFASAQTVTFTATSQVYLYSIIVNPNEEAPAAATLTDIVLDTTNVTKAFEKDATFDSTGLVVKGVYSDNTIVELPSTSYAVDSSAVIMTTDGVYDVTVTIGTISKTYSVTVGSVDTTIKSNTFVTYKGGSYSATATTTTSLNHNDKDGTMVSSTSECTYDNITYNGAVTNGGGNWLKFNTGATISFKVSGACTIKIYYYQGTVNSTVNLDGTTIATSTTPSTASDSTAYEYSVTAGGIVTITSTTNGYIGAIEIVF